MDNTGMKKCPFCTEMISAEANRCPLCRSALQQSGQRPGSRWNSVTWQRVREGRKIAGVCTGLARQFDAPMMILPLRVLFIVTTLFHGFGAVAYAAFWILMPAPESRKQVEKQTQTI